MGLPRSKYVQEGEEGVYHCFSRCVRRAFLQGRDALTGQDFSHRKAWIVDRLRTLSIIFAIEVCAFAVMENHYHVILRIRPDIVAKWSDYEVAKRWLMLFPRRHVRGRPAVSTIEEDIRALAECPDRIATLRQRLSNLSWFMGRLNEYIARSANKEDKVKGRFWESRFKCQVLLDEAAITACMVYVDLNPIRAGLAGTPEESEFTSIKERIRAWHKGMMTASVSTKTAASGGDLHAAQEASNIKSEDARDNSVCGAREAQCASWLCPIQSNSRRRGILQMTAAEYLDLVDRSGRMTKSGKRGAIDVDLLPILRRIGAKPEAWIETISLFGSRFRLAAGLLSNLQKLAHQLGRTRLTGVVAARVAFAHM